MQPLQVGQKDLDTGARSTEGDRLQLAPDQLGDQSAGLEDGGAAHPHAAIDQRRVPEPDAARRAWCSVAVDAVHGALEQSLGELGRIADRRRAGDDRGLAAVEAAQPEEPPQHVGEVRAEDAAVGVELVDDDVAQILEEPHPAGVVRQHTRMQHLGVGDDDVPGVAHRLAYSGWGVAVVRRRAQARRQVAGDVVKRGELILGQRLGGE